MSTAEQATAETLQQLTAAQARLEAATTAINALNTRLQQAQTATAGAEQRATALQNELAAATAATGQERERAITAERHLTTLT